MRYLFADSTPFPLSENFLATLCAATEACVTILQADAEVDECGRLVREAEARAARDLAQLSAVSLRVEQGFGPESGVQPGTSPGEAALGRIREQAWATLDQARKDVLRARDAEITATVQRAPRAKVLPALSAFLTAHQLPETAWGIRWQAGRKGVPSQCELYGRTPFGLEVSFEVAIPQGDLWGRAVPVHMLERGVSIELLRKPFLRKARLVPEVLDGMFVTSVVLTPERASMRLSRSARGPAEGLEIALVGESEILVTRTDKGGYPKSSPEKLAGRDVTTIHRLWGRVTAGLGALVAHRKRATAATFGGVPVGEIARPEQLAGAIIRAIAPLVREIARRTATPFELALKRELGDGCREEIFVTYETVLERTNGLLPRYKAMFDAYGLRETHQSTSSVSIRPLPVVRPPAPRPYAPVAHGPN